MVRFPRVASLVGLLVSVAPAGCSRGSRAAASRESGPVGSVPVAEAPVSRADAVFSAPIAAAAAGPVRFIAGLVVTEKVVRVRAMRAGSVLWTADVHRGATWAPDVDLRLMPAHDGVAVLWGGGAAPGARTMVTLGPHGEELTEPEEIGAAVCVTQDGVAWVDARRTGPVKVRSRRWGDRVTKESVTLPAERDPSLVCGDHVAYVLGDGDDDLTVTAFLPGSNESTAPRVAARDADFGEDEERDHYAYTYGDTLGLVHVAVSGAAALREVPRSGVPAPWRPLKHKLAAEDDVVAVDGDEAATWIVLARDADEACPSVGSSATAVRLLRVDRPSGGEVLADLAAPDCDVVPGPFWIASPPGGQVVAWIERSGKLAPHAPPIRRLTVRSSRSDVPRDAGADIAADALVDGGCDAAGCFAAALVRPFGGDTTGPGAIALVSYP